MILIVQRVLVLFWVLAQIICYCAANYINNVVGGMNRRRARRETLVHAALYACFCMFAFLPFLPSFSNAFVYGGVDLSLLVFRLCGLAYMTTMDALLVIALYNMYTLVKAKRPQRLWPKFVAAGAVWGVTLLFIMQTAGLAPVWQFAPYQLSFISFWFVEASNGVYMACEIVMAVCAFLFYRLVKTLKEEGNHA